MKQISVEDIRFMRLRYRHDDALVRVLDELLEYREAEEQAAEEPKQTAVDVAKGTVWYLPRFLDAFKEKHRKPRTELERECGGA